MHRLRLTFTLIGLSCLLVLTACQRTLVVRFATSSMPQTLEGAGPNGGLMWLDEEVYEWLRQTRSVVVDVADGCATLPQGDHARCLLFEYALGEEFARLGRKVTLASRDGDVPFSADSLVVRGDMPTRERLVTPNPPAFRVGDDLDELERDAAGRCSLAVWEALTNLPTRSEARFEATWSRGSGAPLFRTTERAQGDPALEVASVTVRFEHRTPRSKKPAFGQAFRAAHAAGSARQRHDDEETDFAARSLEAMGTAMASLVIDGVMARRDFCAIEDLPTPSHESQGALILALDRVLATRTARRLPALTP